jgi:hypothetical protein
MSASQVFYTLIMVLVLEPVHDLCNNEEKACFGELQGEKSKPRLVAWADFLTQ